MTLSRLRVALMSCVALLSLAALTACVSDTSSNSAPPGQPGLTAIRISATGTDSLPFMATIQLAQNKGWFSEQGVDVSLYSGSGGGNTLRPVSTGDADIAIAGNTSVVLAAQKADSGIKIVAPWFQVNDFSFIGPQKVSLDGATFGFSSAGSTTELITKALQAKHPGLQTIGVGQSGENWAAAKAGRITAGWAMHPFINQMEEQQGAQVVLDSRTEIGDFPADLVAVNTQFAAAHPEAVSAFFTAMAKTFNYVATDPANAAKDLAPMLKVDAGVLQRGIEQTPEPAKAYSLKVDPAGLKNLSDLMVQAGFIKAPVDWTTALDQQYLPATDRTTM
ncbi:ABC transporter substrate-binding protein [Amycolatopsis taiwanensis]|uniref:Substrate-binding protein, ABC transporter n=1 Tax=Amycolatopsis taiwanensis TaxID=342230 RepID=A0A9W6R232_9PSEU|nr:ABC transporter substrate-binding protein [Amycolatopsis taiwanensis]GLY68111.1 substrate-binding protein, ABC transporter [Amycolatopsis taiwanensis]